MEFHTEKTDALELPGIARRLPLGTIHERIGLPHANRDYKFVFAFIRGGH